MKSILQLITARWRPVIRFAGLSGKQSVYHLTFPNSASPDDIYAAQEGIKAVGFTCLCYKTNHDGLPHLGAFSTC